VTFGRKGERGVRCNTVAGISNFVRDFSFMSVLLLPYFMAIMMTFYYMLVHPNIVHGRYKSVYH
jgi:hypothetical protein